jgi:hypothetical protein
MSAEAPILTTILPEDKTDDLPHKMTVFLLYRMNISCRFYEPFMTKTARAALHEASLPSL